MMVNSTSSLCASLAFVVCFVLSSLLVSNVAGASPSTSWGIASPVAYRQGSSYSRRCDNSRSVASYPYWTSSSSTSSSYMPFETNTDKTKDVQLCASSGLAKNLVRGALLRIASDLSGGTPLESIKCRVTATRDNMFEAYHNIVKEAGYVGLWAGTPSRTVEGALLGALFILGSSFTKKRLLSMGAAPTIAALAAGTVGGVAQAVVMTPAGMIFTSLNVNRGKPGYENDNAITVGARIIKEKGIIGMFYGGGPMCLRQASNWASRAGFTEVARTTFKMSNYGMWGEIGSGVIGGIGSCWNTPIETIRVLMQRDISMGKEANTFGGYWEDIVADSGIPGLFRGVTPRGIQAIWQTVFMVVVPNMLGM